MGRGLPLPLPFPRTLDSPNHCHLIASFFTRAPPRSPKGPTKVPKRTPSDFKIDFWPPRWSQDGSQMDLEWLLGSILVPRKRQHGSKMVPKSVQKLSESKAQETTTQMC